MNDVLPKPFTKEGLLHMLEKHLAHLKKPLSEVGNPNAGGMMAPGAVQTLGTASGRGPSLKDEESPSKSPATTSNWNSPNQVPGVSPVGSATTDEYLTAGVAGGHPAAMYGLPQQPALGYAAGGMPVAPPQPQRQTSAQHRRQISDISGGEDPQQAAKRQQMYAPGGMMGGMPGRR